MRKIPFTKIGFTAIKKEYADLEKQRKPAVIELTIARDMGDRSENAAYKSARMKLSGIDRRLRHLKNLIKFGTITETTHNGIVNIGSVVTVSNGNEETIFTIVGGFESDIANGRLSNISPIGKALVGRKIHDSVKVTVPAGEIYYKITSVL